MSAWPHTDLPGAGRLDEHELDAACYRKQHIRLTHDQLCAVDETAGFCGTCGGHCTTPQACEQPERVAHRKQRRVIVFLGIALGAVICAICWAGYLRVPA